METKTTAIVVAALMGLLACSGVVLSLQAVSAEDVATPTADRPAVRYLCKWRGAIGGWFLRHSVPATVTGDVSVVTRVLLVVDVDGEAVNVMVPRFWAYKDETLSIKDLFDGEPFSMDDPVVLETLMATWEKETHTVTCYVAYTIKIDGEIATALQPFNIDINDAD